MEENVKLGEQATEEVAEVSSENNQDTPVIPMNVEQPESRGDVIEREIKNKAITFETANTLGGMLNDYMVAIVSIETRDWSRLVGIMRNLKNVIDESEKLRESIIDKYVAKDEKGNAIIESYEAPIPEGAPEGTKPEIKQRYAYAEGNREKCTEELTKTIKEKTFFFNYVKMSRSGFLKSHINPQQFKALDVVTRFFVGN